MRRLWLALPAALAALTLTPAPSTAAPTGIPSAATARARLAELTVAPESHNSTYDRGLFPHWSIQHGDCNTREVVLKRDGEDVIRDDTCAAIAGTWRSPYDGAVWHQAGDVDIDHLVALSEAWGSGAWSWSTARREAFANDLIRPELWAVTDDVNEQKGGQDPAGWKPPIRSMHCVYARAWITVKRHWNLTVDPAEKTALRSMLTGC